MNEASHTETTQQYELSYLSISDDSSQLKSALQKHGATLVGEQPVEKVKLSYPIKKQTYAFLGALRFTGALDEGALRKQLNIEQSILRCMMTVIDRKSEAEQRSRAKRSGARPFRREPEAVLTNEAIEKKIQEITND